MTSLGEKLSAYLDGELSDADAREVEHLLETDAAARAEFDALMDANAAAVDEFDQMLAAPVPLSLAQAVSDAPVAANRPAPPARGGLWSSVAAAAVMLAIGATGGYVAGSLGSDAPQVTAGGWLDEIADYHAVYAQQSRHLVEVDASEAAHIQTWLSDTTGVPFSIPDMTDAGLEFRGARLLVAAGLPVGQLIYTDAGGAVVAICLKAATADPFNGFKEKQDGGFELVSWRRAGADYVVVGPTGMTDFGDLAETAATRI